MRDAECRAWPEGSFHSPQEYTEWGFYTGGRQQKPSFNTDAVQGPMQATAPAEWAQALPCSPPGCLQGWWEFSLSRSFPM